MAEEGWGGVRRGEGCEGGKEVRGGLIEWTDGRTDRLTKVFHEVLAGLNSSKSNPRQCDTVLLINHPTQCSLFQTAQTNHSLLLCLKKQTHSDSTSNPSQKQTFFRSVKRKTTFMCTVVVLSG